MENIKIRTVTVGVCSTNCYIAWHKDTKEAFFIDPGDQASTIISVCRQLELIPKAILLTHGHFDHIMAVPELKHEFDIPVYAAEKERDVLENASINLSGMIGRIGLSLHPDHFVEEGDKLEIAGLSIQVLETPGHTKGSTCFYLKEEQVLFSGDTLFCNSYGRVDFPTGSMSQMMHSVRDKLFLLPEETTVFPGHEEATDIAYEKKYNPLA